MANDGKRGNPERNSETDTDLYSEELLLNARAGLALTGQWICGKMGATSPEATRKGAEGRRISGGGLAHTPKGGEAYVDYFDHTYRKICLAIQSKKRQPPPGTVTVVIAIT